MNFKQSTFLKDFSYSLSSNLIALIISALVTFIVPKAISVENYGFFQLYLFYATYVGFFHFGWMDGMFLRYGGAYYSDLDKGLFKGELKLFVLVESIISVLLCILVIIFNKEENNAFILEVTALSIVLTNIRVYYMDILQCTGRIKEYSNLNIIGSIFYLIIIIALLIFGYKGFHYFIFADIFGKLVSTFYGVIKCREILTAKSTDYRLAIAESSENIKVGFKLLFSTLASIAVIGIIRFGIKTAWDVSTFAKVSLTLSVSNLLMVFIRSAALVLFPTLRRIDKERLDNLYETMKVSLMVPMFGVLLLYYPIRIIMSHWLPQYADSLKYMALLFPMCIFESKMSMILETFMKVLRKERSLMFVNIITLGLSFILTGITCLILHNLDFAVLSVVILLAFKCVISEIMMSKYIKQDFLKDLILEIVLAATFVVSSWYIGGGIGALIYLLGYLLYLYYKEQDLLAALKLVNKQSS